MCLWQHMGDVCFQPISVSLFPWRNLPYSGWKRSCSVCSFSPYVQGRPILSCKTCSSIAPLCLATRHPSTPATDAASFTSGHLPSPPSCRCCQLLCPLAPPPTPTLASWHQGPKTIFCRGLQKTVGRPCLCHSVNPQRSWCEKWSNVTLFSDFI